MDQIKIKPLTKEQIIIAADRLTRFKETETKYLRVFFELITGNLITPKFKKSDLENTDYAVLANFASEIINYSLEALGFKTGDNFEINEKLLKYETSVFKISENAKKLLKNKIDYYSVIKLISNSDVPNLIWLKNLGKNYDIEQQREKEGFLFPLKMILIAEGATEETLLPEFGKLCGFDFYKKGVYIISAGGKNQVVKMYYKYAELLNLPIFVLLDKDAAENLEEIYPKLRKTDKIHLLKCGEFEDLLQDDLVKRTLDYELNNISVLEKEILDSDKPRAKVLEEIFKTRGRHEFKKVEFANLVKKNIKSKSDVSPEISEIIKEIESAYIK